MRVNKISKSTIKVIAQKTRLVWRIIKILWLSGRVLCWLEDLLIGDS